MAENEEVKLLWDFTVQTDQEINSSPETIVIYIGYFVIHKKKMRETVIVDTAVPGDSNVVRKQKERQEKYQDLAREKEFVEYKDESCASGCGGSGTSFKDVGSSFGPVGNSR